MTSQQQAQQAQTTVTRLIETLKHAEAAMLHAQRAEIFAVVSPDDAMAHCQRLTDMAQAADLVRELRGTKTRVFIFKGERALIERGRVWSVVIGDERTLVDDNVDDVVLDDTGDVSDTRSALDDDDGDMDDGPQLSPLFSGAAPMRAPEGAQLWGEDAPDDPADTAAQDADVEQPSDS